MNEKRHEVAVTIEGELHSNEVVVLGPLEGCRTYKTHGHVVLEVAGMMVTLARLHRMARWALEVRAAMDDGEVKAREISIGWGAGNPLISFVVPADSKVHDLT